MSRIEIKLNHPLPYAEAVFIFLKQERDNDNIYLIYPVNSEKTLTNILPHQSRDKVLSYEGQRDLIALRETLKTVFEVNGMDFEKAKMTDYPKPSKGRYEIETDKV